MTRGDRLLRNSAIACALLLGILTLGNLRQPWAEKAAQGIERALTMHINLDESIGELTFVRQIMPESALVFLNVSGSTALAHPCDGAITHPWSDLQPWMAYEQACRPFLAVAIDNNENTYGGHILEDLPKALIFVAGRFSTFAAEGSAEAVIEAREHFTVGGLSRGCIYAYSVLENEPEYAANYLCLSCGGRRDALEAALKNTPYGLSRYFAGIGARDETFYSRTKWTYEGVKPFAGQAEMAVYAYGHDWSTWFNGLYDGLRFLLPLAEEAGPEGEIF